MKKVRLMLQYFDEIIGPKIYRLIVENQKEKIWKDKKEKEFNKYEIQIRDALTDYFEDLFNAANYGFFAYNLAGDYQFSSANYYFSIYCPKVRGKEQFLMLSVILPPNENPSNYRDVLNKTSLRIKKTKDIYQYLNTSHIDKINPLDEILEESYAEIMGRIEKGSGICFEEECREFITPRIFCSRCISFEYCRWNSQIISSREVDALKDFVDFITKCPEKDIGLGVPRDRIRIVSIGGKDRLIQPKTGKDVSEDMREYAKKFCEDERVVDGFILKSESPSCGFRRTKIWKDSEKPQIDHMGAGFFGRKIKKEFSHLPIINEGMLRNERLRSNFLTQTFCIAEFRKMRENPTKKSLIEFQTKHKLLFMAYDQERMKKMGRIVGNQAKKPLEDVMEEYSKLFYQLINKIPSYRSHVNVIQHALGYFKNKISSQEKEFFLAELERYENGVVNLNTIIHLIREWIIRFQEDYLANQSYFQPYPEDLDFRAYSVSNKQKDKLRRRK